MSRPSAPPYRCINTISKCMQKATTRPPTTKKHNPSKTTREHPNPKRRRRRQEGKKKQAGAGLGLGEGEHEDEQVEVAVRVQDEGTQGESQTPNGVWVSPAPEKERKREKRRRRNYPTHTEKRKRTTNTNANKGQVLKGTNPNNNTTPETKITTQKNHTNIPKAPNKIPLTNQTKSQRNVHSRVAGPMGRPALLGRHPRGPQY